MTATLAPPPMSTPTPAVVIVFPPEVAALLDRVASPAPFGDALVAPVEFDVATAHAFAAALDDRARILAAAARLVRIAANYPEAAATRYRDPDAVRNALGVPIAVEWRGPLPEIH